MTSSSSAFRLLTLDGLFRSGHIDGRGIAEILLENEVFERLLRRFDGLCGRGRTGQLVDRCLLIIDLGVKRIALLRQIIDGTFKIINDGFRITFCLFSLFDFIIDYSQLQFILHAIEST